MKDIEDDLEGYDIDINEGLIWNFYQVYAIIMLFNQFDFYLSSVNYLDELLEIMSKCG